MSKEPQVGKKGLSFVIPAYNEEGAIVETLERLKVALEKTKHDHEIIVVNDGSRDATKEHAAKIKGIKVISHPINTGYGSAIKTGVANAQYEWIGIVDADGTYEIENLHLLVEKMEGGFEMAIAERGNVLQTDKLLKRMFRKTLLKFIGIWVSGKIKDPNSGFRIFTRSFVMSFYPFLCDTFSFTTSSTIFAIGEGYFVSYVPMNYSKRVGKSKVSHVRDSFRMIQLILQGITFFNPLKFFIMLILAMLLSVDIPAFVLMQIGYDSLAFYYVLAGTISFLLFGIGVLADITRISSTMNIRKMHSITGRGRTTL